jgi:hypothetical protein
MRVDTRVDAHRRLALFRDSHRGRFGGAPPGSDGFVHEFRDF